MRLVMVPLTFWLFAKSAIILIQKNIPERILLQERVVNSSTDTLNSPGIDLLVQAVNIKVTEIKALHLRLYFRDINGKWKREDQ